MISIERGYLGRGVAGTDSAMLTFGSLLQLADGALLATCRAGSTKDSADERVTLFRSTDNGHNWSELHRFAFHEPIDGARGSLKLVYLSELARGHLLAAGMWVDRETYPGRGLFNPETEGCLPMFIVLSDSHDNGETWQPWRVVELPADIGPASLTNPILKLPGGTLAMSIETNKHYLDSSPWRQRVVLFHSDDGGRSWGTPVVSGQDQHGRIFYWDQRAGVAPDGRIAAFEWTYDKQDGTYLNIHRAISADGGRSWSAFEDLDITDQPGHPAVLPDGRVVLPWVDRFHTRSIRARLAPAVDAPFEPDSEVVLYQLEQPGATVSSGESTGELLAEMAVWTFGLPYAEALPDGDVLVLYYAGTEQALDIHSVRLRLGG